jgi:hypothetical protein
MKLILLNHKLPSENRALSDDIVAHVKTAYALYASPYIINGQPKKRTIHGISHASRVTYYIQVLINLYKRYDDRVHLDHDEVKLLQLAALFHDAGRCGEGADLWELKSSTLFYHYAIKNCGLDKTKAIRFAEVIANKDFVPGKKYHFIEAYDDKSVTWNTKNSNQEKSVLQEILHDADCLDIIRARDRFDATYLDFYKKYIANDERKFKETLQFQLSMLELAQLICEVRSLIEHCGDTRDENVRERQKIYDNPNCYSLICDCIKQNVKGFPVMSTLSRAPLSLKEVKDLRMFQKQTDLSSVEQLIHYRSNPLNGPLLMFRGTPTPSAINASLTHENMHQFLSSCIFSKSYAANLEMLLMYRRRGIFSAVKNGNDNRSVSILGCGAGVFASAGFGYKISSVRELNQVFTRGDGQTRFGAKVGLQVDSSNREEKMYELMQNLLMGGLFARTSSHSEALMNIQRADYIVFSNDPNEGTYNTRLRDCRPYSGVPLLEALFIHAYYCIYVTRLPRYPEYETVSEVIDLPIYEYSGLHNQLEKIIFPSNVDLLCIWKRLADRFFESTTDEYSEVDDKTLILLKAMICYGVSEYNWQGLYKIEPLDKFYPSALKNEINEYLKDKIYQHELKNFKKSLLTNRAIVNTILFEVASYLKNQKGNVSGLPVLLKRIIYNNNRSEEVDPYYQACEIFRKNGILEDYWVKTISKSRGESASCSKPPYVFRLFPFNSRVWVTEHSLVIMNQDDSRFISINDCNMNMIDFSIIAEINAVFPRGNEHYLKIHEWILHRLNIESQLEGNKKTLILKYFYALLILPRHLRETTYLEEFQGLQKTILDSEILVISATDDTKARALKSAIAFYLYHEHKVAIGNHSNILHLADIISLVSSSACSDELSACLHQLFLSFNPDFLKRFFFDASPSSALSAASRSLLSWCDKILLGNYNPAYYGFIQVLFETAPINIWMVPLNGDILLQKLFKAVESNPDNINLLGLAKIVARKAPPEAWSESLLIKLCYVISHNSQNISLLEILQDAFCNAPPDALPLYQICTLAQHKVPSGTELQLKYNKIAQLVLQRAPKESWVKRRPGYSESVFESMLIDYSCGQRKKYLVMLIKAVVEGDSEEIWLPKKLDDEVTPLNRIIKRIIDNLNDTYENDTYEIANIAIRKTPKRLWLQSFTKINRGVYSKNDPSLLHELLNTVIDNPNNNRLLELVWNVVSSAPLEIWSEDIVDLQSALLVNQLLDSVNLYPNNKELRIIATKVAENAKAAADAKAATDVKAAADARALKVQPLTNRLIDLSNIKSLMANAQLEVLVNNMNTLITDYIQNNPKDFVTHFQSCIMGMQNHTFVKNTPIVQDILRDLLFVVVSIFTLGTFNAYQRVKNNDDTYGHRFFQSAPAVSKAVLKILAHEVDSFKSMSNVDPPRKANEGQKIQR